MDAKRSMVSGVLRLLAAVPAREDPGKRRSDDERPLRNDRDMDREPADAVDSFLWSWQFPSRL